jgi:GNAT superfamily N-acetyltransferase
MVSSELVLRRGHYSDLTAVMEIWYANETADDPQPPARPALLSEYPHLLDYGDLWMAERDEIAVGFSGAAPRGETTFLTDLFIDPRNHSEGVGNKLLQQALDPYPRESCFTVSSSDMRALALYARYGMQPLWPNFMLHAHKLVPGSFAGHGLQVSQADPYDPEYVGWDAAASGRVRPQDIAFWVEREDGVSLWMEQDGERIGYAMIRLRGGSIWQHRAARLGPIGVREPGHATAVLMAAIDWTMQHTQHLRVDLLGPHPGLATLLASGFRINYVETLMMAGKNPFFDPRCYAGSGGALF